MSGHGRRANASSFRPGRRTHNRLPVGAVTIRRRPSRPTEKPRAWVKVAEPNVWKPRAVVVWEAANGPVPKGHVVHHVDRNRLNEDLANLELESRAAHLQEHRPEFEAKRARAAATARWGSA